MGNIIIPGFPTGMLVPGIYMNVELGRQPPSAAGVVRKVLLVGTNTDPSSSSSSSSSSSGGSDYETPTVKALANTLYRVSRLRKRSTTDMASAEVLFGVNEDYITDKLIEYVPDPNDRHLYWMCRAAFQANPFVDLYAVMIDPAHGLEDALSTVEAQRFHYIVVDSTDSDDIKTFIEYLEKQAQPKTGFREQGLIGDTTTLDAEGPAELTTLSPRLQRVWAPLGEPEPDWQQLAFDLVGRKRSGQDEAHPYYFDCQLAAAVAATRQKHEAVDPAVNLCMEKVPGVPSIPIGNKATQTKLNTLLQDGVTPLVTTTAGTVILRSVTTAANPNDCPTPVIDTGKVTVSDYLADDIEMKMLTRYAGFKLAPDTDVPPPSRTATPNGVRSSLLEWLKAAEKAGLITYVDSLADRIKVEIDPDVDGRLNFEIPEDVIEIFAVGAGNIIQIG